MTRPRRSTTRPAPCRSACPVYNTVVRIVGDDGQDLPGRRGRRDRHQRADGGARLLEQAGGDRARAAGRRAAHRRRRLHGRGRLVLHRRPEEGPDQRRRLQGVAARGRGRPLPARGGARGRRGRGARRLPRRDRQGLRQPAPRPDATAEELIAFCREQMAAYKYPARSSSSTNCPRPSPASCSAASSATAASGLPGKVLPWTSQPPGACTTSSCGCLTWAAPSRRTRALRRLPGQHRQLRGRARRRRVLTDGRGPWPAEPRKPTLDHEGRYPGEGSA